MPTWMIVVLCTVGAFLLLGSVLGALAVFGVRKYIANAKTAEARMEVAAIARAAAAAQASSQRVCPSASQPVPASLLAVKGSKYQSAPSDWSIDEKRNAGFACLGFAIDTPQYYQYSYTATATGFDAVAHGDLNGNGAVSTFALHGEVGADGAVAIDPTLEERSPQE
jgi:type IV pilus assembly protein PilA